jgi:hypothetical protein
MNIYKLISECLDFKNAILKTDKNKLSIALKEFPSGSCGWCNDLLLYHFKKINFPDIKNIYYISAYINEIHTHGWLEIDNIIIDLTLSQFHKRFKKVIFNNKRWHKKFKIESKNMILFSEIEDFLLSVTTKENYKNLVSDYSEIMKNYKFI